jgi:hypothetical protein
LRFQKGKGKGKTLGNFFEKKFPKPFKKLYPETALRFQKGFPLLCIKGTQCFSPYKLARSAGLCTRSSARALVGGLGAESPQGFALALALTTLAESPKVLIFQ